MRQQLKRNQNVSSTLWRHCGVLLLLATISVVPDFSPVVTSAQNAKKLPAAQPVSAVQFHYLMKENAAADASARLDAFPARSFERHSRRLQVMTSKANTPYQRLV